MTFPWPLAVPANRPRGLALSIRLLVPGKGTLASSAGRVVGSLEAQTRGWRNCAPCTPSAPFCTLPFFLVFLSIILPEVRPSPLTAIA